MELIQSRYRDFSPTLVDEKLREQLDAVDLQNDLKTGRTGPKFANSGSLLLGGSNTRLGRDNELLPAIARDLLVRESEE